MATLNADARAVLRSAGITPAVWARAHGYRPWTWGGDACGCPDDRCKDGYHHYPDDECGCLRTLLYSYVAGEGQFDGESGYVIRDPLWAQVRQIRRRADGHSGKQPSELLRVAAALDEVLKLAGDWYDSGDVGRQFAAKELREAITGALLGEEAGDVPAH